MRCNKLFLTICSILLIATACTSRPSPAPTPTLRPRPTTVIGTRLSAWPYAPGYLDLIEEWLRDLR